jgi:hypothetical protein
MGCTESKQQSNVAEQKKPSSISSITQSSGNTIDSTPQAPSVPQALPDRKIDDFYEFGKQVIWRLFIVLILDDLFAI